MVNKSTILTCQLPDLKESSATDLLGTFQFIRHSPVIYFLLINENGVLGTVLLLERRLQKASSAYNRLCYLMGYLKGKTLGQ